MRRWLPLAAVLVIGCGGDDGNGTGPDLGSIQVAVTTSGEALPGAYAVTLDGVQVAQVAASGGTTLSLVSAGTYDVGLTPVPENCTVQGDNPVEVSVVGGSQSQVAFTVQCVPLAATAVVTATTGARPEPVGAARQGRHGGGPGS